MEQGMKAQIPADHFLEQAIAALTVADSSALRQLEASVLTVAAPRNRTAYAARRATFAALLDATARNLRFLRRVTGKQSSGFYTPSPR
jgi:hypothetical protein